MGIHLNDLPPKVREQVARKMVGKTHTRTVGPPSPRRGQGERIATSAAPSRNDSAEGKYHNQKAVRYVGDNAIRFDSQKEARRFDELVLLQKAGKIRELKLQVDFTLQEAYTLPETGNRVRAIRYRADFTYLERVRDDFGWCVQGSVDADDPSVSCADSSPCAREPLGAGEGWRYVVEDVKSEATKTRTYQLKRKLMLDRYGIQIREV
jgi:hypothetical protein